jgi:excisionase family DNA binding protein
LIGMAETTREDRVMAALAMSRGLVTPTDEEAKVAVESSRTLAAHAGGSGLRVEIKNGDGGGEELVLPAPAVRLLLNVLTELGQGNAVALDTVQPELSTQQAAGLLNVSRPYLVKLLDEGAIPSRKVGTHRRVLREDVLAYKRDIDEKRLKALEELAEQAQELDMGY